jgi:hypothetical protein
LHLHNKTIYYISFLSYNSVSSSTPPAGLQTFFFDIFVFLLAFLPSFLFFFFFNSALACRGSVHNRKFWQLIHNTSQCYFHAKIPPPVTRKNEVLNVSRTWRVKLHGGAGTKRRKLRRVKCKSLQRCETRILHKLSKLLNEWLITLLNEWLITILTKSANSLIPSP